MDGSTLVDVTSIAGAIAFFVPVLVSLITKKEASDGVKAAAAVAGSVVAAVVGLWVGPDANDNVTWQLVVTTVLFTLVTQLSAYKAVWQFRVAPAVAELTENFGVGRKVVPGEVLDH